MGGTPEIQLLLNMQMIEDDIEDDYNILAFSRHGDSQKLAGASIYYGQKELDPAFVYVAEADVFEKHPIGNPEICRISVGPLKCRPEFPDYPLIEVDGRECWKGLFNRVQGVFVRYVSWSQRLFHILNSGGGLYELCVAALDFFQNPLYIHDENFNVLAQPKWVVGMTQFMVDETSGNTMVPLEKVQNFKTNPAYIDTLSTHGAQMWNPSYNAHRVLYVNIWVGGQQYRGRFLINELSTPLKPSDFTMAEYFVKILTMAFERNIFKSSSANRFEKILLRLFQGEHVEEGYLSDRLRMVGWDRTHRYVCFKTELEKGENEVLSSRKVSSTIGLYLKDSFSFPLSKEVYTVCNLTLSGYEPSQYREVMEYLCQTLEGVVGVSEPFEDFSQLREYYRQAGKAMEIGRQRTNSRYLPFSDYVLEYIICKSTEEFSARAICSGAILRLHAMDREKNTNYIQTLSCYLENGCHQTATAQAMYIHRSTLAYRLERIEELTDVDLRDADTRLYLQISIKLLENL